MNTSHQQRSGSWRWWICGLLLCASTINYMDRQTLANAAVRITKQFQLSNEQYGNLEMGFGWAFAAGSLVFGFLADAISVRWVYPAVLLLWSSVGFATGLVESYGGLLICRTLLGFFEAGHWPCAIKTTLKLLEPKDRSLGNSVLQSGTSIGAIITPLVMRFLLTDQLESWRFAFQLIGLVGLAWIVAWLWLVRAGDLDNDTPRSTMRDDPANATTLRRALLGRKMLSVLIVIALINTSWQTLRAWLPKFLQEGRGFSERAALDFNSLFYIATDVGCLVAGFLTLWLVKRGWSVHASRVGVFAGCAALTALTTMVPLLPKGWALGAVLLCVGAGILGLFPIYHALTQDISPAHQGKVTGIASVAAWLFAPPAQKLFGWMVDRTHSYDLGLVVAGWLPLLALLALVVLWRDPVFRTGDRSTQAVRG